MKQYKNSKKKILDAFCTLMQEKEFEDITVLMITERADITKTTFYRHFRDKYDLLCYNIRYFYECITPTKDGWNWSESIMKMLKHIQENYVFYKKAFMYEEQNNFIDYSIEETVSSIMHYIDEMFDLEETKREDVLFAVRYYSIGTVLMTIRWINEGVKESPENMLLRLQSCVPSVLWPYFEFNTLDSSSGSQQ